jgi:hypothetical protein
MEIFNSKFCKLSGSNYREIKKKADILLTEIRRKTKRRPYLRSDYFYKEKIFFEYFEEHLRQKNFSDRIRRLKFIQASLELLKYSRNAPEISENRNRAGEKLYRFKGKTADGYLFVVQVKENKKTGQKYFMSCFPEK